VFSTVLFFVPQRGFSSISRTTLHIKVFRKNMFNPLLACHRALDLINKWYACHRLRTDELKNRRVCSDLIKGYDSNRGRRRKRGFNLAMSVGLPPGMSLIKTSFFRKICLFPITYPLPMVVNQNVAVVVDGWGFWVPFLFVLYF
jgi:hypothetical protein